MTDMRLIVSRVICTTVLLSMLTLASEAAQTLSLSGGESPSVCHGRRHLGLLRLPEPVSRHATLRLPDLGDRHAERERRASFGAVKEVFAETISKQQK